MNKAEAETLGAVHTHTHTHTHIMFIRKKYIIAEETKLIKNYRK